MKDSFKIFYSSTWGSSLEFVSPRTLSSKFDSFTSEMFDTDPVDCISWETSDYWILVVFFIILFSSIGEFYRRDGELIYSGS